MKQKIIVSAPGKIILLGEHAVVYGKPALIAAVDKRCYVYISPGNERQVKIVSKNLQSEIITGFDLINGKFDKAQTDWNKFNENNDINLLKSITKEPLDYPEIIIGQFLEYSKINSINGFDLIIDSEIPAGCGMGSSAALAVSIIGALFLFTKKNFDKKIINEIAFLCERIKHGNASGGDNSTSCFGGLTRFQKGKEIESFGIKLSPNIIKNFYVVNTGAPDESTGEMVSMVRSLCQEKPEKIDAVFTDQERLTGNLLKELDKGNEDKIMQIIRSGEDNLEKIGVASNFVIKLIKKISKSGGAAKICGAGGKTQGSGMILIYHKNLQALENVLESYKLKAEQLKLGMQGVRKEL